LSFINKALEKAKSLHQKKGAPGGPADHEKPLIPSSPAFDQVWEMEETPGEIQYTCTRKVAVDMDNLRRNRLIVTGCERVIEDAYRLLRTHILHRTKPEGRNVLMLTGPLQNEGKTLTAINLAISISHKVGETVLLVDGDLRNPSIHRCLGLPSGPGLVDYLVSGYPIRDSLVHPEGLADLVVLPAGRSMTESTELLSSPVMVDLVKELKHFYPNRYVLFDLPPLLYPDPLAFAPLVDGIILVVEAESTPKEEINRCVELLKDFPLLGFVLNKVELKALSYGYHYPYDSGKSVEKKYKLPWFK
jgi:protein-tyrosine kinase